MRSSASLLILLSFLCASWPVLAKERFSRPFQPNHFYAQQSNKRPVMSADEAKRMAEQQYGGRALSVKLESNGVLSVYRVKLIKGGRVKMVTIPAN